MDNISTTKSIASAFAKTVYIVFNLYLINVNFANSFVIFNIIS